MTQDAVEQIDPFVKRVTTVRPGDMVIFRYLGRFRDQKMVDDLQAKFEAKMGDIPFLVIDDQIDLTVLKAQVGPQIHVA